MGTLGGHVLPGSFFLIFGLWSVVCIFKRYFLCTREANLSGRGVRGRTRYRNTLLHPCCCCCTRLPMAAILIVAATTIGIIGEVVTGFKNGHFQQYGNLQHITMYSFFLMMAVVNILQEHCKFSMIPHLDYLAALLSLAMEGILFAYHLHGRTSMDKQVHNFLLYVILGCAVSGALEMKYVSSVVPAIARSYFIVLQGTWFWTVGFILYPPSGMSPWQQEDHRQMMIVTCIFTWNFAAVFLLFCGIGLFVNCRVRLMSRSNVYQLLEVHSPSGRKETVNNTSVLNNSKMDAEQTRSIISESEEEI